MPRVVHFHGSGGPEVLKIEDVTSMPPSKNEVALTGQPIGLNRPESMFMHGHYLEQTERRRPSTHCGTNCGRGLRL
jgi:NADPH:quinone reductase-like Zn-dependent oxidoreductase